MKEGTANNTDHRTRDYVVEIISTVIMSLATLGSAWSAYQATRWSGVQAINFGQASASRTEAVRKTNIAEQKIGIDVGLFMQYAVARTEDNQKLADFLFQRFTPELSTATKAWLETEPLINPDAPPSPFSTPQYRLAELDEAEALLKRAERNTESAKEANQTGDNYVLLTVLFASVLFFSGVGTKLGLFSMRVTMLVLGGIILLTTVIALMGFPVH